MTDWVRKQIEKAKERQEQARRKLDRRGLDDRTLGVQTLALWDSLRERIGGAVGEFNEGMSLAKPLQFTKKSDELVYVTKEDFPSYSFNVQLQDQLNSILYRLSCSNSPRHPMQLIREETLTFDVDEEGRTWFVLGTQWLKVDEAAEFMLAPIFEAVA